jgi:cytochrome c oxidase subunit II
MLLDHSAMSTLGAGSREAARVTQLTWFLIIVAAVVYVIVIAAMLFAIMRRRDVGIDTVDLAPKSVRPVILGGAVIPGAILLVLFIAGLGAMRAYPTPAGATPLRFTVVGHQWWWEATYGDSTSAEGFHTASEIHVPVGRQVEITLTSADVIHSFWVPRLQGKIDVIPGDTNTIRFTAAKPGTFRGQCAEYCGVQHANMAFSIVAEEPAAFQRWLDAQRRPAASPADAKARLGEQLVVTGPCASCHTIGGTPAAGRMGPDLTHVASRAMLAAGTLDNNRATMEAWITNAQSLKPGVLMPNLPQFTGRELLAMTSYLESLR